VRVADAKSGEPRELHSPKARRHLGAITSKPQTTKRESKNLPNQKSSTKLRRMETRPRDETKNKHAGRIDNEYSLERTEETRMKSSICRTHPPLPNPNQTLLRLLEECGRRGDGK